MNNKLIALIQCAELSQDGIEPATLAAIEAAKAEQSQILDALDDTCEALKSWVEIAEDEDMRESDYAEIDRANEILNRMRDNTPRVDMKVTVIIGANAYACIKTNDRSLDVLLEPGKSTGASLLNAAHEMRQKANAMLERAAIIEQAAFHA